MNIHATDAVANAQWEATEDVASLRSTAERCFARNAAPVAQSAGVMRTFTILISVGGARIAQYETPQTGTDTTPSRRPTASQHRLGPASQPPSPRCLNTPDTR